MASDGLLYALGRAKLTGSKKTVYNHKAEARRFVRQLRACGFWVRRWENLTNKHVAAVVAAWRAQNLAVATIKEYLAGVRAVARAYGNERLADDNDAFGLEHRVYVDNLDKSVPDAVYQSAVERLASGSDDERRVAVQLELQRELGLRKEEAFKFSGRCLLADGRVFVTDGTKGGRDRMLHEPSARQRAVIQRVCELGGDRNTMPPELSERQWERRYYRAIRAAGISKAACGTSGHGLRHAYAQARYESLTGFPCRVKFPSLREFYSHASHVAGDGWERIDRDARLILKAELGHGPDRDDVVSQYIGASR